MSVRLVTVFGGTGFLGRRVVRHLREQGLSVRIASRHPDRSRSLFGSDDRQLQAVEADIHDEQTVADALADAYGAVNAISLSPSLYIRKRGEGEMAVRAAFSDAILIRPAVMFGEGDAFLTVILALLRRLPIYPMFGRGLTRLQPAYVEDVAEAIARALQDPQVHAATFECGGPRVYSYEELLRTVAREAGLKRVLIPLPFAAWHALARIAEMVPSVPITRNQVELMQIDNVVSAQTPGFAELGISPCSVEDVLGRMLRGG